MKNLNNLVALTPGFRGNEGFDVTGAYSGQIGGDLHGKGGTNVQFDGMGIQHASGNQGYNANAETVQEMVMYTSGITADSNADGAIVNMIPKEGSNSSPAAHRALLQRQPDERQPQRRTDRSRPQERQPPQLHLRCRIHARRSDQEGSVWFYGSFREWGNKRQAANKFYNATQGTPFYTADLIRPAFAKEWYESKAIRVTWRATEKNKFNFFADPQRDCHCPALTASGSVNAPEAFFSYKLKPAGLYQVTWSDPITNKLLLEAGAGRADGSWPIYRQPEVTRDDVSIVEQSTGMRYNSGTPTFGPLYYSTSSCRDSVSAVSASYITGGHNFKAGRSIRRKLPRDRSRERHPQRGVRIQQSGASQPHTMGDAVRAQSAEQGLRVLRAGSVDDEAVDAHLRYPVRILQRLRAVTARERDAERVGARAQLRRGEEHPAVEGRRSARRRRVRRVRQRQNGVKVAIGRYVGKTGIAITQNNNPIQTSINSVNRTWNDSFYPVGDPRRGNYVPDCDLANRALNGECGAMANQNFGGLNVTTRYADDALLGYDSRGYNWDFTTEVQHELRPGVSMNGGYYRNWFGNSPGHRQHLW